MKRIKIVILCLVGFLAIALTEDPIRVAGVGDSITYGHGIRDREHDAYPAVLGSILGEKYDVRNFGISGRTLMNSGDSPYMKEQIYKDALAFNPNIVTIKLGTNDSKPYNWVHNQDFKKDLKLLINSFRELPSKPEIYLCLPAPPMGNAWNISDSVVYNYIIPCIKEVASEEKLPVIDLYSPLKPHKEFFPDTIHPNEQGAVFIAKIIYKALTGHEYKN